MAEKSGDRSQDPTEAIDLHEDDTGTSELQLTDAEHIGTAASEEETQAMDLPPPVPQQKRRAQPTPPAPVRERIPVPSGPPLAATAPDPADVFTVLFVGFAGPGFASGGGDDLLRKMLVGDSIGPRSKAVHGGLLFAARSSVKAARATVEIRERVAGHNGGVAPAAQVEVRFGLARGSAHSEPLALDGPDAEVAAGLGLLAAVGEVWMTGETLEDIGSQACTSERLGRQAPTTIEGTVIAYRLDHIDLTLAIPVPVPVPERGSRRRTMVWVVTAAVAIGVLAFLALRW